MESKYLFEHYGNGLLFRFDIVSGKAWLCEGQAPFFTWKEVAEK
jgi:hypothetical protein